MSNEPIKLCLPKKLLNKKKTQAQRLQEAEKLIEVMKEALDSCCHVYGQYWVNEEAVKAALAAHKKWKEGKE